MVDKRNQGPKRYARRRQKKIQEHIGFDLGVNVSGATADAGTQGTRIGQFFLKAEATPTGHPFQSVTAFCNPLLTAP